MVAGFSTHPHFDHLLWHEGLGDVPLYATATGAEIARANRERAAEAAAEQADGVPLELVARVEALPGLDGGPVPGELIEHKAHAMGHAALLLADRRVLLAGDMLSDVLVPLFDFRQEDQVGAYAAALGQLAEVVDRVDVLVPGHGSVAEGPEIAARLAADVAYIEALRARRGTGRPAPRAGLAPRRAPPGERAAGARLVRAFSPSHEVEEARGAQVGRASTTPSSRTATPPSFVVLKASAPSWRSVAATVASSPAAIGAVKRHARGGSAGSGRRRGGRRRAAEIARARVAVPWSTGWDRPATRAARGSVWIGFQMRRALAVDDGVGGLDPEARRRRGAVSVAIGSGRPARGALRSARAVRVEPR